MKIRKFNLSEKAGLSLIICGIIVISVFLVYNMTLFYVGLHNIDLGQNIEWLNAKYDLDLHDQLNTGKVVGGTELYQIGTRQVNKTIWNVLFYSFALGMSFILLIDKALKKCQK